MAAKRTSPEVARDIHAFPTRVDSRRRWRSCDPAWQDDRYSRLGRNRPQAYSMSRENGFTRQALGFSFLRMSLIPKPLHTFGIHGLVLRVDLLQSVCGMRRCELAQQGGIGHALAQACRRGGGT